MEIWVAGKDGFSERGVTCYPREINVFVTGGQKTATRGEERGLRSETKACWYNEDGLDLYPIKVSGLKAKSFPNNGVIARRRPLPGNSVRYVRGVSSGLDTAGHSSGSATGGGRTRRRSGERRDCCVAALSRR